MADHAKYKRAVRADIAYNMMRLWQGAVGVAPVDGLVSPAYVVANPHPGVDSRYYTYLFRIGAYMEEVNKYSHGIVTDRNRLYWDEFKQMPSVFPPPEEQRAITRYLDRQNLVISRLIQAKRTLISVLNEQKQAIIHRAVTCGLDPKVRLKPSGILWLGDVPEDWGIKRLKWVVRLQRGYDLPSEKREPGTVPVVSSGGVIDTHSKSRAKGPGVAMGRYGSTDSVFYIEQDFWPHNTALFVTDFQGNVERWCYYMLRTISKGDYAGKSAVPGVDRKDLYEIVVPVPPRNEQMTVAESLDSRLAELNRATETIYHEIDLTREYRARLIADVVTGRIDIREAACSLPAETEEPEVISEAETEEDAELIPEESDE
jgi:type I restriction enzyme S subunit